MLWYEHSDDVDAISFFFFWFLNKGNSYINKIVEL